MSGAIGGSLVRRVGAVAAAAGLVAVGLVAAAPASVAFTSSGTVRITATCTGDIDLYANVGDIIEITLPGTLACEGFSIWNQNGPVGSVTGAGFLLPIAINGPGGQGDWYSYSGTTPKDWYIFSSIAPDIDGTATAQLLGTDGAGNPLEVGSTVALNNFAATDSPRYLITYRGPRQADTDEGPASWYQSYGRPSSSDTCLDGWHPSWGHWMNDGTGGFTCDREQYWDGSGWPFRASTR